MMMIWGMPKPGPQKESVVFQLSFFRGELLNFGGVPTITQQCCGIVAAFFPHL